MPYRTVGQGPDAAVEVLLITSRETRRWIIPKGNIDHQMAPSSAAAEEAEEEAGALGMIGQEPLGCFDYVKQLRSGSSVIAKVVVFPLEVDQLLDDWKEREQRERRWFSQAEAAEAVQEPELRDIIRSFAPH